MNNKLLTIRQTGRITCVWVPAGNIRNPLACVWVEADTFHTASAALSSSNDDPGGPFVMNTDAELLDGFNEYRIHGDQFGL
jgi:hypothetical protein